MVCLLVLTAKEGVTDVWLSDLYKQGSLLDEYTQPALTTMYINVDMIDKWWSWFEKFMTNDCKKASSCCLSRQKLTVVC